MKYAKITNGIVEQTQPNQEAGFVEVPDYVVAHMVEDGNGGFVAPTPTQAQIAIFKF